MVTSLALLLPLCAPLQAAPDEADYYRIANVTIPDGITLEVSGIALLPDGRPLVCTRRGHVYVIDNAYATEPGEPVFNLFADGLQEPLGLLPHDGWIYFVQRGELSRMRDLDGDDKVDELETVADHWRISGNYHEYNFGPRLGPDGKLWITTNKPFGDEPFGRVEWRGWALRLSVDGEMEPMCCGLRSPAGIQNSPWGDMFYTDNQGEWCGASKLSHLEPGAFHGHPWGIGSSELPQWKHGRQDAPPDGKPMPEVAQEMPSFKLPAVWFPYDKMGKSPAGLVWDQTGGKFGPFDGQVLVGDQHHASILRVFLEQVNGHWQGACFRFREDLQCGIIRVAWGADDSLLVGMSNRGWGGRGSGTFGLQRVVWTGKTPFEIHEMRARSDGFELTFTAPVDAKSAGDPASYQMQSYTYLLHSSYGSPEVDTAAVPVVSAEVQQGGTSVRLRVDGLRAGYVHELHLPGVRATSGEPLLHPEAYYTLIEIP